MIAQPIKIRTASRRTWADDTAKNIEWFNRVCPPAIVRRYPIDGIVLGLDAARELNRIVTSGSVLRPEEGTPQRITHDTFKEHGLVRYVAEVGASGQREWFTVPTPVATAAFEKLRADRAAGRR